MLNLRRKLLVSVFTLMLAVCAVATTTYAWFTMGNETTVSNIEMSVQGSDGLMIRVVSVNGHKYLEDDAKYGWSTDLNLTGVLSGVKLAPMSLQDRVATGTYVNTSDQLKTLTSGANYDATNSFANVPAFAGTETKVEGNYIEIEFEFRSEAELDVKFKTLKAATVGTVSFITPVKVISNKLTGADEIKEVLVGQAVENARLANALRISVNEATFTDGGSDKAHNYTSGYAGYSKLINPSIYDALTKQYGTWGKAAVEYYNATSHYDIEAPAKEYDYEMDDLTSVICDLKYSTGLNAYFGKVQVRIWLEGWDADAFNAVITDHANLSMSFEGVRTGA